MIYTQQLFKRIYELQNFLLGFAVHHVFCIFRVFCRQRFDDSSSSADTLDVNYLNGKEQVANQVTRQPFGIC